MYHFFLFQLTVAMMDMINTVASQTLSKYFCVPVGDSNHVSRDLWINGLIHKTIIFLCLFLCLFYSILSIKYDGDISCNVQQSSVLCCLLHVYLLVSCQSYTRIILKKQYKTIVLKSNFYYTKHPFLNTHYDTQHSFNLNWFKTHNVQITCN